MNLSLALSAVAVVTMGCGPTIVSRRATVSSDHRDPRCSSAVECYTIALERLADSTRLLDEARQSIGREMPPVGAVVPFFLRPEEVATLGPSWLPADGRTLHDPGSLLNGRVLPDMTNRFPYGTDATSDVVAPHAENSGGSLSLPPNSLPVSGTTSAARLIDRVDTRMSQNLSTRFVIDTEQDELTISEHTHEVNSNNPTAISLPAPPYRRLIFMVRCR